MGLVVVATAAAVMAKAAAVVVAKAGLVIIVISRTLCKFSQRQQQLLWL